MQLEQVLGSIGSSLGMIRHSAIRPTSQSQAMEGEGPATVAERPGLATILGRVSELLEWLQRASARNPAGSNAYAYA